MDLSLIKLIVFMKSVKSHRDLISHLSDYVESEYLHLWLCEMTDVHCKVTHTHTQILVTLTFITSCFFFLLIHNFFIILPHSSSSGVRMLEANSVKVINMQKHGNTQA